MEQNHGRPNQAELLQNFQRLDELDTEFRGLANDIMAVFMRPDLTPDDVIMTGSAAEGCLLARWFREGKAIFEVDLLFAGISLTQDNFEKNIEELPRKPGFVKILYDKTIADSFHPKLRSDIIAIQNSIESPYLCGGRIKRDMTLRRIRYQDEEGAVKLIVSMFLGVPMTSISVDDKSDVDGPSANVYVNVKTPTGHFLEYSSDNVPAARCDFWPPLAKEWISRQRRWPSDDVITGIVQKGCHLVAKSTVGGDEDFEWRWSFSIAEKELALRRNPHQRLCYLMFKSIFYARMKFEINSKTLPSYLVKTVMMRMCEQLPPSEWSGDTLVARLTDLFVELERYFSDLFRYENIHYSAFQTFRQSTYS